jgi:hypothetical protein
VICEQWNIYGAGHAWSEVAPRGPTQIREGRMPREECCVSSSHVTSHGNQASGILHFSGPGVRGAAGDTHSYQQLFLHHSYLAMRSRNGSPEQVSSSASPFWPPAQMHSRRRGWPQRRGAGPGDSPGRIYRFSQGCLINHSRNSAKIKDSMKTRAAPKVSYFCQVLGSLDVSVRFAMCSA